MAIVFLTMGTCFASRWAPLTPRILRATKSTSTVIPHLAHFARVFSVGMAATAAASEASGTSASQCAPTLSEARQKWSYLNAADATQVDVDLMSPEGGFAIEQLMELAGLSVAAAAVKMFPLPADPAAETPTRTAGDHPSKPRLLIVCGPGNNGGDGLVAARHLHHFGYQVMVVYPKQSATNQLYQGLVTQLHALGIPVLKSVAEAHSSLGSGVGFDGAIDAIFGFSFKGEPRPPFDDILTFLKTSGLPLLSVDVPSGWSVDEGDKGGSGLRPDALVSLTAPKLCAKRFQGRHFLGGRFVPPNIVHKYGLVLPPYPGAEQVVEITDAGATAVTEPALATTRQEEEEDEGRVYEGHTVARGSEARDEVAVVWVTAPSAEAGKTLAGSLVRQKLVACGNVVPGVESVYEWEGKVETSTEALLMLKTTAASLPALTAAIAKEHAYEVPETIAAAVIGGNREYLGWVRENTRK